MRKIILVLCMVIIILIISLKLQDNTSINDHTSLINFQEGFFSLHTEIEAPYTSIIFAFNQTSVYPGDCLSLYISNAKKTTDFSVIVPFYDKPISFFPYENGFLSIIPVYAWLSKGTYEIEATNLIENTSILFRIEVLPKDFDIQYLTVPEVITEINNNDNASKDQAYFDAARANPIQEKLWEGPFIQPAQGKITTDYNSTRYTNDNPTPSRHLAIDIANIEGTLIKASNNGKVVLARNLIVTGNSVVIDHGMGLFSSSFHMSEIIVSEGTYVSKGDVIGKMGSTGYSTGPHLHFAFWKEGTFLNPWFFFKNDPVP